MPCLLFYSVLTLTRIFIFSWLNGFDLQQIALSKQKNDADWLDSGTPLRKFKPRAALHPLKHLRSPRQSSFSLRHALIHICFNVSAFGTKLLGNAQERNPAKTAEEELPGTDRCIEEWWCGMKWKLGRVRVEGVEHQVCVCDAKFWPCAARQKASQEQVKEKERRTKKRTSRQTKVMLMKGDFGAMTSHFLSSRGHVLPHKVKCS